MTAMNSRELDSFIGELVRFYGVERAIYVLSRTIQFSDWDSRFDQAVLDRAGRTDFPDARTPRDENHVDPTTRYVTEIDPCVANAIFMKLMELSCAGCAVWGIVRSTSMPTTITESFVMRRRHWNRGNQNDVSKGMEPVAPDNRDGGWTDRHPYLFRAVCLTAGGGLTGTSKTERETGRRNPSGGQTTGGTGAQRSLFYADSGDACHEKRIGEHSPE